MDTDGNTIRYLARLYLGRSVLPQIYEFAMDKFLLNLLGLPFKPKSVSAGAIIPH
jgi:hypothetical protein